MSYCPSSLYLIEWNPRNNILSPLSGRMSHDGRMTDCARLLPVFPLLMLLYVTFERCCVATDLTGVPEIGIYNLYKSVHRMHAYEQLYAQLRS